MYGIHKKVRIMIVGTVISVLAVCNATFAFYPSEESNDTSVEISAPAQDSGSNQTRIEENKALIELFKGFRVCDVRDAMDWVGYHNFGSIAPEVRPVFRSPHHVVGIARTARYLPFVGPYPLERGDAYTEWQGMYYSKICTYPWINEIEEGDFMAIDVSGADSGLCGSENTLRCVLRGCVGMVFNGSGIRDTDEVILQNKLPVWSHFISQAMVQARIQFDAKDIPVAIGGVTIFPGDIIVADGDGVIVVPRKF